MPLTAKEVSNAMEVGQSSTQAARYLQSQAHRSKELSSNRAAIQLIDNYADNVQHMRDSSTPVWATGEQREVDPVKNMLKNKAASDAEGLKDIAAKGLHVSLAVTDQGKITRSFFSEGYKLKEADAAKMDGVMQSWFAQNNYAFHNGKVVLLDTLKTNPENPTPANPEEVRQKISDDKTGFQKFCEQSNIPIDLKLYKEVGAQPIVDKSRASVKEAMQEKQAPSVTAETTVTETQGAEVTSPGSRR